MKLIDRIRSLAPARRLAEYARHRPGGGLFPEFAAVVAGLRPGMDDWVRVSEYEAFRGFAKKHGLQMAADAAFRRIDSEASKSIAGFETLTTTHALGITVRDARPDDELHVFVAPDQGVLQTLRESGWYPLVVHDRVFHKPFVDHMTFGRALGYPECCVQFFERSNNWSRTNSYAESFAATRTAPHYRANCFGKLRNFSLVFHMPCRFDCPATLDFAERLEVFLGSEEPKYLEACRRLLTLPVLCVSERDVVLIDGSATGPDRAEYADVCDLARTDGALLGALAEGDAVEVRGRFVVVLQRGRTVRVIETRADVFPPPSPTPHPLGSRIMTADDRVRRRLERSREQTARHNLVAPQAYFASREWTETYRGIRAWFPGGTERSCPDFPVFHLYLHVPYCEERCRFCMYYFDHVLNVSDSFESYVGQLEASIDFFSEAVSRRSVDAAYVGGGTPSVLSDDQIGRLLSAVGRRFRLCEAGQYTFELSPRSATLEKIETVAAHGFNRISLGVQSFDDEVLTRANRAKVSPDAVGRLVAGALRAGIEDVNVDVMAGLPGESEDSLKRTVKSLAAIGVPAISVYRYRPLRSGEYEAYGGPDSYLNGVQPRVDRAVDLALGLGYAASPTQSEHIRLTNRHGKLPSRDARHRYQTRFHASIDNSLLGIGHGAWSFVRDEYFIEMPYRTNCRGDLLDNEVRVQYSDPPFRMAAYVVNRLYEDRAIDGELFTARFGVPFNELYAPEIALLVREGVGKWHGPRFEVTPRSAAEWAYYDKLFYPDSWLDALPPAK